MSVMYGSGAFFGVINIFTNKVTNKSRKQVTASLGTQNTHKLTLRSSGKEGSFSYTFNGGLYKSRGIDQPYNKMMSPEMALQMPTNGTGGLLENDELYLNLSGEFDKFYSDFSFIQTQNEFYLIEPSYKNGSISKYITSNAVLGYKDNLSDKLSLDAKFGYFSTNHKLNYDFYFPDSYNYQVLQGESFEIDLNMNYDISQTVNLTFGYNYRSATDIQSRVHIPSSGWGTLYNTTSETSPGEHIVTHGFFSQLEYTPMDNLRLVAGLRFEQMPGYKLRRVDATDSLGVPPLILEDTYSQEEVSFIPRLAMLYTFNESNVIKIMYGKAINRPSFWHIHAQLLHGVISLKPETIQTFEMNFTSVPFDELIVNMSLFYNHLDNLITRDHGLDNEGNYYDTEINSGEKSTYGIELTTQIRPLSEFNIEISGSYQKSKDITYNNTPGYSPEFLAYLKAYFYLNSDAIISLTGNYVGSMESMWISNPDGTGQRISNEDFGSYFSLGANIRLNNIFNSSVFLSLRGSNLLNTEIPYPTFSNNQLFTKGTLGQSREVLVTIGIKL